MSTAFTAEELALWTNGQWEPAPPPVVDGVSHDTRSLQSGNVFFALRGDRFDGHAFLDEAFRRGASGAVIHAPHSRAGTADQPLLRVADSAEALRVAALAYRLKLNPHIVAVTGSAGKSTVKELAGQILDRQAPTARTRGNWNNAIGLPLSLLSMPAGTRYGVFEVGMNHAGEIAELCRILKPCWGVVTNIGPVHMEFFKSLEDIAQEKATMLRSLAADSVAVLHRDGGFFERLRDASPGRVVTVSLRGGADYVCTARRTQSMEIDLEETSTGETPTLRLPSVSEYNTVNALMAIAVARGLGVGWAEIQAALERFEALPMRWQELSVEGGVRLINDAYNANPMSMRASIRAFEEDRRTGRKWLLLSGMRELGAAEKDEHLKLGEYVAEGDWAGLITVGALGDLVAHGAEIGGMDKGRIVRCADHAAAARAVRGRVAPGDTVLLKASRGMKLEEVIAHLRNGEGGKS